MSRRKIQAHDLAPCEARSQRAPSLRCFTIQHGQVLELERARNKSAPLHLIKRPGLRYCETCSTHQPRGKRPAMKGWRCDRCLRSAAAAIARTRA